MGTCYDNKLIRVIRHKNVLPPDRLLAINCALTVDEVAMTGGLEALLLLPGGIETAIRSREEQGFRAIRV
jgi:hypothetical protein